MTAIKPTMYLITRRLKNDKRVLKVLESFENKWNKEIKKGIILIDITLKDGSSILHYEDPEDHLHKMITHLRNTDDTLKAVYTTSKDTGFHPLFGIDDSSQVVINIILIENSRERIIGCRPVPTIGDYMRHTEYKDNAFDFIYDDSSFIDVISDLIEEGLSSVDIDYLMSRHKDEALTEVEMVQNTVLAHLGVHFIDTAKPIESTLFTGVYQAKSPLNSLDSDFYYTVNNIFNGNQLFSFKINLIKSSTAYNGIPLVELIVLNNNDEIYMRELVYLYDPLYRNSIKYTDGESLGAKLIYVRNLMMKDLTFVDSVSRRMASIKMATINSVYDYRFNKRNLVYSPINSFDTKKGMKRAKNLSKVIPKFYLMNDLDKFKDINPIDSLLKLESIKQYIVNGIDVDMQIDDVYNLKRMSEIFRHHTLDFQPINKVDSLSVAIGETIEINSSESELKSINDTDSYTEYKFTKK